MRHIIPISGKDSLATAILQKDRSPYLDYELVFNPVGFELPETLVWLDTVETYLQQKIIRVGVNLWETPEWQAGFRPGINSRYCTRKGKIEPTENYFDCEGYIYYGLRADEPDRIGYINKGKSELTPIYTLRELCYDLDAVLELVSNTPCPPPAFFWQLLHDMFVAELGLDFLQTNLTAYQLSMLFAWRVRQNCFNCFFMRRYEWVGLDYHHPELFDWQIEAETDKQDRSKMFLTIPGLPLTELRKKKDEILDRHVRTMSNKLRLMYKNRDAKSDLFNDILSMTSCGLLCGK